jgi:hypothetical protein
MCVFTHDLDTHNILSRLDTLYRHSFETQLQCYYGDNMFALSKMCLSTVLSDTVFFHYYGLYPSWLYFSDFPHLLILSCVWALWDKTSRGFVLVHLSEIVCHCLSTKSIMDSVNIFLRLIYHIHMHIFTCKINDVENKCNCHNKYLCLA